ncbi:MAG TPA: FHA domain-containing protein [Anaerolineales bacterium]|nr:FHA domain-containing protein [Anaerolineales bacterium]
MTVIEKICPVCKESNEPNAIICLHCGATLEDPSPNSGTRTKRTDLPADVLEGIQEWSVDESAVPEYGLAVYVEGEFSPIHKDSTGELVIGRKSGKTAKLTDNLLDLSANGGYGQGVSRRHAVIRQMEQGYEVFDLGSSNGTWLNERRLAPHKHYPLESGSHLRLGKMRLFVLYRPDK